MGPIFTMLNIIMVSNCNIKFSTIAINYRNERGLVFVSVFTIFWFGSYIISQNNTKLGVPTSFFQCVCYLGYSMFPLNFMSLLFAIFSFNIIIAIVLVIAMMFWSVKGMIIIFII